MTGGTPISRAPPLHLSVGHYGDTADDKRAAMEEDTTGTHRPPLPQGSHQTCAKVPKRFEILGSLSSRSGTLMDLGPCSSFLLWDSGNPGPQNCVMPQDPGNPGPQDFDMQ